MTKQDWTKDLRSKLSDYQAPIPEGLWDDIEASLPQTMPARRHVSMIPWRKWSAAAAIALALVGGGTYLWQQYGSGDTVPLASAGKQGQTVTAFDSPNQIAVADEVTVAEDAVVNQGVTGMTHALPIAANTVRPFREVSRPVASDRLSQPEQSFTSEGPTVVDHSPSTEPSTMIAQADVEVKTEDKKETGMPTAPSRKPLGDVGYLPVPWDVPMTPRKGNAPFAMGLFASNDALSFSGSSPVIDYAMANNALFDVNDASSVALFRLRGYEEKTRHHRPISMGLGMQFGLAKRLSLSTGLVYSNLKSDYIYEMGGTTLERNQVLHYVGVPMNVIYTLWSKYGLSVYATAGAQADFCVKAILESEGVKKDIDKDRVQFSTLVGLGMQYNFVPSVGLYVEPTLKYYFDNGSSVDNAFKDRPTNVGFQFGLRYNFNR
ncbi:MAG: hypothetical protein J5637_02445 [Prevotella sp.]|nr:hypothetical protein [Prevotella sp.]